MDGSCDTAPSSSLLLLKRAGLITILRGPASAFVTHDYCAARVDAPVGFAYYPPRLSRCEASLFGTSRSGLRFKQGSFCERKDISGVHEAAPLPLLIVRAGPRNVVCARIRVWEWRPNGPAGLWTRN